MPASRRRGRGVKLKAVSHTMFVGAILALLANFAFLLLIRSAFDHSAQVAGQREQTIRALEHLRQEAELLRRLVRAYTATGSTKYLLDLLRHLCDPPG